MLAASSYASGISTLPHGVPARPSPLRRCLMLLSAWVQPRRYRPERHYMRGGSTIGSRSLAAAHARIAGRG
jgi:hypothetical protein